MFPLVPQNMAVCKIYINNFIQLFISIDVDKKASLLRNEQSTSEKIWHIKSLNTLL